MHARRTTMILLAIGCTAACTDGRSGKTPAPESAEHPRSSTMAGSRRDTTPAVLQSGEASLPRYVAGKYELVLDRDEPLFDDSLAARDYVERQLAWSAVDSARDWRDTVRAIDAPNVFARESVRSGDDSAAAARELLDRLRCTEWRSGGTLTLEADGRFDLRDEMRSYCRGKVPAYTRRTTRPNDEEMALESCAAWGAPAPGTVPHLSCESGRWWYGRIGYRYVGDTLTLNSDCDGRDTYVLRVPNPSAQYAVKRSSDVSRLEEC